MSLLDDIKKRMFQAMKAQSLVEKEILRVAIGEITTAQARENKDLDQEQMEGILKKLLKSNREALEAASEPATRSQLEEEIVVLTSLLPKTLGVEEVKAALLGVAAQLREAKGEGPAMGLAMKTLKAAKLAVEAPVVSQAVSELRGA